MNTSLTIYDLTNAYYFGIIEGIVIGAIIMAIIWYRKSH